MEIPIRNKEQLGQALKRFRQNTGQTQTALSQESRIDQAMISKVESGARAPELATLLHLCSVLGIEIILRSRKSK